MGWGARLCQASRSTCCHQVPRGVEDAHAMCLNLTLSLLLVPAPASKAQDVRSLWSLTHCVFMSFSEFQETRGRVGGLAWRQGTLLGIRGFLDFPQWEKHVRFFILFLDFWFEHAL